MDIGNIIKLYTVDKWSLRMIADKYQTNHHHIKKLLVEQGIPIIKNNHKRIFTEEHKKNISKSRKKLKDRGWKPYNTGLKTMDRENGKEIICKNMKAHLKYDVPLEWLMSFDDIEKLKLLNKSISRKRDNAGFDTDLYIKFIEKFYYDTQFNKVYNLWLKKQDRYSKPSLDHIIPKSKGGKLNDLDNLQFITWLENRIKNDLYIDEWNNIKNNIKEYLI